MIEGLLDLLGDEAAVWKRAGHSEGREWRSGAWRGSK